ncbi:hypothetical protein WOLCODRAFT_99902 [Wolfiporia cocos MD-104 SS10]|uniref:RRM domain-containing protein n=1 Tax=Wolfiporia cocos (strain MD-104) TaxID=742152 RepID=A0A2H3JHU9_WOLCO|nr:hypothetical protein WOLCODRAFT_99902 [Wolfiporia cocos MD-104 SS10]
MENGTGVDKPHAKVVIVTNLTRNVVEAHLRTIFGFYGEIIKIDLPVFGKSRQNRGKAALEYVDSTSAHRAQSHMDGGQLDGAILKVELSELPVRSRSRSPRPPPRPRYGRDRPRSLSRTPSRSRSPPRRFARGGRFGDSYRGRPLGRRGPPPRDTYRPLSRSRSRSPVRRGDRLPPRRRSPSYERGGTGFRRRSRSRSYSVRSSRSRTRSLTPRSRTRSLSYSSYSRYSRSRSRTRSLSRGRRSHSRDDIRDSRSRSPRD